MVGAIDWLDSGHEPALAGFVGLPPALAGGLRKVDEVLSRLQPGFSTWLQPLKGEQGLKPPLKKFG